MRNHAWAETEWDTIQTSFAPDINPQYYTAERATALFLVAKIKSGHTFQQHYGSSPLVLATVWHDMSVTTILEALWPWERR